MNRPRKSYARPPDPPKPGEVRANNAMALWHRVLARPAVLAPLIRTPAVGP